jgi:hypothetical protein
MEVPKVLTATIAIDGNLSGAIDLEGYERGTVMVPTIVSAVLTFQGSADGVTFANLYSGVAAKAEINIGAACTGDKAVNLPAEVMACKWIKIRTGTAASPVTQTTTARVFTFCLK